MSQMDNATLRRFVYGLLITVTAAIATARIIGAELVYEPSIAVRAWPKERPEKMPTFSSNDRSRWSTIRALVENGTFVVGKRTIVDGSLYAEALRLENVGLDPAKIYRDEGIAFQDGYRSVDYVQNPKTHEYYSSKPPLFSAMVAGEYWLLNKLLGWSLTESHDRWPVVCTILITVNVLPLIIFLRLLANLLEEYGSTDWGRLFVFTSACFGTFLTTFAVTLNNHTPAACCVMAAFYPLLRGRALDSSIRFAPSELLIAGFFAGLAVTLDLPAAAFAAALGLIVLLRSPRGIIWFGLAAIIPVGALIATNYIAIGEVLPAYSKFGGEWYEYPGSHWFKVKLNPNQSGIDFAHESKEVYLFQTLLGHHGLFSLTPIWLFALAGMVLPAPRALLRRMNLMTLAVTAVVIAFYVWRTNNYGGWTSGPRWQFWLTPLFLMAMIPIADRLAETRIGRGLAYLFLAIAAFSATYPVWNPWRHPWAYTLCEYMDWVKY